MDSQSAAAAAAAAAAASSGAKDNSLLDTVMNGANNDTLQKLAMLAYVTNPDKGKPIMQGLLTAQLVQKAYHHLSGADKVEALRQETIMNIATYVKEHPRARPNEIQIKVEDEINIFKQKLKNI